VTSKPTLDARHQSDGTPRTAAESPPTILRGRQGEVTNLAVLVGGVPALRASLRVGNVGMRLARIVRIADLELHPGSVGVGAEPNVEAAVHSIVRHVGIGAEGVWDLLHIRSPSLGDIVGAAAWQFANAMDYGIDMLPRSDDGVMIRVRVPGRRAAIAHFMLSAPDMHGMATRVRSFTHELRRRVAVARTPSASGAEVDMLLEMPRAGTPVSPPAGVEFCEVEAETVLKHPRRYASFGIDTDVRLGRGDRCFASQVAGRVVFRMWVSTDLLFIRRRSERLGALGRAAYVYDSFTDPAWRGRSIRGASLCWLADRMTGEVDRIVLSVEADNLPSIRAAQKAGFRQLDT
jgi:hypothetical protein